MARKEKGITVVSPMYGPRKVTDRMVFSVLHQYISKQNPFKIHLVLVDDYIEERREDGSSPYDFYLSDTFKEMYDTEKIKITLIKNPEHKYQGESREIGWKKGDYNFFILVDCDDMLAPNACDRYLNIVNQSVAKQEKPIACIHGLLYSFDTNGYEHNIPGHSIWVQARCYNRLFINRYKLHFLKGINSRQGEDYPFIRKLDYAIAHQDEFQTVKIPYNEQSHPDTQATAFWFPNENSLSRKDPHYGQHLSGWTMASSNSILDYFDNFNKTYEFEDEQDEYMKHEYLNMAIYSFYNLLDFLKEVSSTDYKPVEEDWYMLRDNVAKLRNRLKSKYWDEIVYSDIEDMLYNVKNHSDCRFVESWIGNFYDYINCEDGIVMDIFNMDYDAMMKYCKEELKFDQANHEIHSPQVVAWERRHLSVKR